MNERTKELIEQCTEVWENSAGEWDLYFDQEEFARLIIDDCINVVIECDDNPKMILHEPYRTIINRIAEHFGVDE